MIRRIIREQPRPFAENQKSRPSCHAERSGFEFVFRSGPALRDENADPTFTALSQARLRNYFFFATLHFSGPLLRMIQAIAINQFCFLVRFVNLLKILFLDF